MTPPAAIGSDWRFVRIGLLVSGKGERAFLPQLLGALEADGRCTLHVVRRFDQLSPYGAARLLEVAGRGGGVPDRAFEQIGAPAKAYLRHPDTFIVLVDDLEWDRREQAQAAFVRYRGILDVALGEAAARASVHFLVMMLEAYYFADPAAVNAVLGTALPEPEGDVEAIRHPKNELKRLVHGFDEIEHGRQIVARLDLDKALSDPSTCRALRTLIKWCVKAKGGELTDRFQLADGELWDVTRGQIDALPS